MWYALYCPGIKEEVILESCEKRMDSKFLKSAFIFTFERMRRYEGDWHRETARMFPEYVFLESDDEERLSRLLDEYRPFLQVLESDGCLIPVKKEEEKLLQELGGKNHHMSMSRGVIQQGVTHILEGPLAGREHMIRKIDRHKRLAFLDVSMLPGTVSMKAGLEIIDKTI